MSQLPRLSKDFKTAFLASLEDHERYGDIDSGDWQENGAMRVVGIGRGDTLRMMRFVLQTSGDGLDESPAARAETLLAVIELMLSTGVHLERARYEQG